MTIITTTTITNKQLRDAILHLLDVRRISVFQLSKRMGVEHNIIAGLLSGRSKPRITLRSAIAEALEQYLSEGQDVNLEAPSRVSYRVPARSCAVGVALDAINKVPNPKKTESKTSERAEYLKLASETLQSIIAAGRFPLSTDEELANHAVQMTNAILRVADKRYPKP